jgi:hypothetical protein
MCKLNDSIQNKIVDGRKNLDIRQTNRLIHGMYECQKKNKKIAIYLIFFISTPFN